MGSTCSHPSRRSKDPVPPPHAWEVALASGYSSCFVLVTITSPCPFSPKGLEMSSVACLWVWGHLPFPITASLPAE